MKTSFFLILLALLSGTTLSGFVAKKSVTVSGITYQIGNNGNDCAVSRTEGGKTIFWYYLYDIGSPDDCVGQNIFAIGSEIWVVLTITSNLNIIITRNTAAGGTTVWLSDEVVPATAIVLGQIDTSDTFEIFGKFSWAVLDVAVDIPGDSPAPIEFVSVKKCSEEKTLQFTVNVQTGKQYGLVDYPIQTISIDGFELKQVFDPANKSLKAYKASTVPSCTVEEESKSGKLLGNWWLSLIALALLFLMW